MPKRNYSVLKTRWSNKEEMDRRMMMMVQMDEGLWNALLELDSLMQEKKSLATQLKELILSSAIEVKQALLRGLQEEESVLLEQERSLKLRREQLRKTLAEASEKTEEVSQGENPVKPGSSSRSKPYRKASEKKRDTEIITWRKKQTKQNFFFFFFFFF
ncbi:trichohyalin isoform X2 [Puntigrus tetrazona]|uniref:trichohyalin isoform X2 n=1 Tax=Puntigrus tetrazona TaxID=1606681 RepID=UPI001C8AEA08|nr:trichohyalin isoform X2 [Puntigrus tetrazona]